MQKPVESRASSQIKETAQYSVSIALCKIYCRKNVWGISRVSPGKEIPQRIVLEPVAFSEDAGLLTASGKLSRTALIRRFWHAGCACQTV